MMRRPHRVAHAIALATLVWGLACCDSAANQGKAYFDDMKLRAEAGEAVAQVAIANIYRGNHVTSHVVTGASATAAMDTKGVVDEAPVAVIVGPGGAEDNQVRFIALAAIQGADGDEPCRKEFRAAILQAAEVSLV